MTMPHFFAPAEPRYPSRREMLSRAGNGMGMLALASLLGDSGLAAAAVPAGTPDPMAAKPSHFPAKAKRVIWLFMNGGPSHVDTWDYKPELAKRDGKELPGFDKNTGFFTAAVGPLMKSPFSFAQHGQSGAWVSSIFPNLAKHVDKMAFLHSCWTDSNNHSPALFKVNTGMARQGFPCVGSWVTYGLGSESRNLPAFVVMYDTLGRGIPKGHSQNWGAGFLPSIYQGTAFKPQGDPIDNLRRPNGMDDSQQRKQLDLLAKLNRRKIDPNLGEPDLAARIETFELAYRMQMAAPDALDLSKEDSATQKLYGLDNPKATHFAKQCLMARRLVERGVRFVQIYSGGMENELSWDGHQDIIKNHAGFAAETDQPIAGLLTDLANRGMLEDTLVIWGGEFGRLPIVQKGGTGRDHNPHAFTVWMAGGGVKGGVHHGATDEVGFKAVEDRVSINDLHATILHLIGMDHKRLTYRFNGRDFRLTDVAGNVVKSILA
ncbi:DUF1501 domain-containing protein [Tuwongella immobilis]|uniref:DUF1501 domain-containing protein n=1 Tax=Tuwongella immobilis TaxID=692036 RepID=A0A6C2YV31_9BACT|nr:DUF1501 domain-containing protein [Tuwongella immobilis]VIP05470.1 protein containing duf1501 : Uncharacterized protein OS=Pirellula staleyi (strain ATCC 27377 / DSM 6068 / ICPB 4128) GN=Psta_3350 PE=4 SV=1: DUF1501 [Tuwongella immobilis]VTS08296.1 protein containing duf1501 : Uncharacterized protein OS=Pirellula staleyi (strain ATCC 27377 / DSM 6068 / ICPB 4128) GN=Psta_3350 PE=4 SV=1: DUF1501 [Tuwongella immobilis]